MSLKQQLEHLLRTDSLNAAEAAALAQSLMAEDADARLQAAILALLAKRPITATELGAFANFLRQQMKKISSPLGAIDVCGTGGDGVGTANISTMVAVLVASLGVPVAKHGNRAVSSKSGSADVLQELGIDIANAANRAEEHLHKLGLCFLFAPQFHPILKNIAPVRQALGVRTIFNVLGPLLNPAMVKYQLLGVYQQSLLPNMCATLQQLGTECALLIHGTGGLDELSLEGDNEAMLLKNAATSTLTINARDYGLTPAPNSALAGGDARTNAQIMQNVLQGQPSAIADAVAFNAASALWVQGKAADMQQGLQQAQHALQQGQAWLLLQKYKEACQ